MSERINKSWREQRKGVVAVPKTVTSDTDIRLFISVWQASHTIASEFGCSPDTAKKEIKRSITTGNPRYGMIWHWQV